MIDFRNVTKRFSSQDVLVDVSFRINKNERVGIVGPNGAGKSTIFSLLTGEQSQDAGEISMPHDTKIGCVRQQLNPHTVSASILEYAEDAVADIQHLQREIDELTHLLAESPDSDRPQALKRLGDVQTRFEHMGGYAVRHKAEAALTGLGFAPDAMDRPFATFSGGWQMRAELARIIIATPDILLLDEPTNYLDLPAIEWLRQRLDSFNGTLVVISHDRYLLNTLTTITLEVAHARVTRYQGNCDYYLLEREQRHEHARAQQKNIARRREQVERFIERFRAKNTKSSQVQSRIKMLEKMEETDVPVVVHTSGRIRIAKPPHCGVEVLRLDDAGASYDGQTFVWRHIEVSIARGDKTGLVGLNGTGKTTLLRAMAGAMPLQEGKRKLGHNVLIGYQAQEFADNLPPEQTVYAVVKSAAPNVYEKDVRTLLGGFGFTGEAVEKQVAVLSGGEKIRLAFARLLINPPNFLLLDEPTTHLDMDSRRMLQNALVAYEGTICFVSHDVEFVRAVATTIIAMTPPGVTKYTGGYEFYRNRLMAAEQRAAEQAAAVAAKALKVEQKKGGRHERALLVQERARKRRPFEKIIADAEKKIDALDREEKELVAKIEANEPGIDFFDVNRRLVEIQKATDAATAKWEQAAKKLEELAKAADP